MMCFVPQPGRGVSNRQLSISEINNCKLHFTFLKQTHTHNNKTIMRAATLFAVVGLGAISAFSFLPTAAAADSSGLKIEKTHEIDSCKRRTRAGDTVAMHYRGTLASTGKEFDASYNRGQPLSFTVGKGMVIKGYVFLFFFS